MLFDASGCEKRPSSIPDEIVLPVPAPSSSAASDPPKQLPSAMPALVPGEPYVRHGELSDLSQRPANDVWWAGLKQQESDAFLARLKDAVERGDRALVASMIAYPSELRLNGQGPLVMIVNKSEFIAKYTSIVTERVVSELRSTTPQTVVANSQGVGTNRGAIWFGGVCEDDRCGKYEILVTRINNHPIAGKTPR
jgi:hypothetical protein